MQPNYKQLANDARKKVIQMIHKAQSSHVGSNFSCIDILTVIFENVNLHQDRVLVKSWTAASLYYFLAKKGVIYEEDLEEFGQGRYVTVLDPIPGVVKYATGAMGYNLPFGVGIALSKKFKGEKGKVFIVMSDGEMDIGMTWEAALIASHNKLNNLVVIIDRNGLQAMGKTDDTLSTEPLDEKWKSFGWEVVQIDGHSHQAIERTIIRDTPKPLLIIADCIKGKGVSFMEGQNIWHYSHVSDETLSKALQELE